MPTHDPSRALIRLEPIDPGIVPRAGYDELVRYEQDRQKLHDDGAEAVSWTGLLGASALFFLLVMLPTLGSSALAFIIVLAFGSAAGISSIATLGWFAKTCLRLAYQHDPRLYLPEGISEDDARFEDASRRAIADWNHRAEAWNKAVGLLEDDPPETSRKQLVVTAARLLEEKERILDGVAKLRRKALACKVKQPPPLLPPKNPA